MENMFNILRLSKNEDKDSFDNLRRFNLLLFSLIPLALIFSRVASESIVAFIGLSFLWVLIKQRQWDKLTTGCIGILLITWLLLNLIISPQAFNPETSFLRSLLWIRFILFFAAITTWLLRSLDDLKIILVFWLVILSLAMLDGFVQWGTGMSLSGNELPPGRLTGPLDRPNVGTFVARLGFPILGVALLAHNTAPFSPRRLTALVMYIIAAYIFIVLSGDRTTIMLTMVAVFGAVGFLLLFSRPMRIFAAVAGIVAVAIPMILHTYSRSVESRADAFVSHVSDFWSSPYGEIFHAGFRMWLDNPITGVGLKGFREVCLLLDPALSWGCQPHPHNVYIEWLCETGLVGFICFIIFVVVLVAPVVRLIFTRPDQLLVGLALAGGLTVILFPVAATQSFFSNWPAMLLWSAFGVITVTARIALSDTHAASADIEGGGK